MTAHRASLVAAIVLLAGCTTPLTSEESSPQPPTDPTPLGNVTGGNELPTVAVAEPDAYDLVLSDCNGIFAIMGWPNTQGYPFQPPENWHPSTSGATYLVYAANCQRASSTTGFVTENVTFGFEGHGNVSREGKENWSGSYNDMASPLTTTWKAAQEFPLYGWSTGKLLEGGVVLGDFDAEWGHAQGSWQTSAGRLDLEIALVPLPGGPVQGTPQKYRLVTDGPEDVYYDLTVTETQRGASYACTGAATGDLRINEHPLAHDGKLVLLGCSIFIDTTIELQRGGIA